MASLVLLLTGCRGPEPAVQRSAAAADSLPPQDAAHLLIAGFSSPESVLHDPVADVYLVSNIVGDPVARDGDGFVSRVSPAGEIIELRWIDGRSPGTELHAPKGMALRGDSLFVADIDCVRIFHRSSGEPAGAVCPEGASFLNDVAADDAGRIHVTDTGVRPAAGGLEPAGGDAIWRFTPEDGVVAVAGGGHLGGPNGIAFGPLGAAVATWGTGEVYQLSDDGTRREILPAVAGRRLDGIEFLPEGGFLVSSWGEGAVLYVSPLGELTVAVPDVQGAADIGFDRRRGRVLVPLLPSNEILILLLRLEG